MSAMRDIEARFNRACELLLGELGSGEAMALDFGGESSDFLRFNKGRVRQLGHVDSAGLQFTYYRDGSTIASGIDLTGEEAVDAERAAAALASARREAALLPEDPYQTLPEAKGSSREEFPGTLPDHGKIPAEVLGPGSAISAAGAEYVGIHSQGAICRGAANSLGAKHWFATETFCTDYSAYLPNGKALKSAYAGREWNATEYARRLSLAKPKLEGLARPEKVMQPGEYRVYIAPDALNKFIAFFSWNGLGERGLREGESAYIALREGRRSMSTKFALSQDFSLGVEPRFNELGEIAPERLTLIEGGKLMNSIVSARSAKQYGVPSNAAPVWEGVRSPSIAAGSLDEDNAVEALGTGLYVSNFHYLNWSDNDSGRITGMTRFACFWVEGGKIAAPIKDMRFDESIYNVFGEKLVDLTKQRSLVAETSSYFQRALGGALLPGILVDRFTFTL